LIVVVLIVVVLWVIILGLYLIVARRQPDVRAQMQALEAQLDQQPVEETRSR
jgi:hypothetical protein